MNYVCGDNRFEIIERYKKELISATNIECSPDEMAVLDNILFRFWQMGWLKEQEAVTIKKTKEHGFGVSGGICPKCRNWIQSAHSFCGFCGQAVKWE